MSWFKLFLSAGTEILFRITDKGAQDKIQHEKKLFIKVKLMKFWREPIRTMEEVGVGVMKAEEANSPVRATEG